MKLISVNTDPDKTTYYALRHLFDGARVSSVSDKHWKISSTMTEPEKCVFTEYWHEPTEDTISCQSFNYDGERFTKHLFMFRTKDAEI